jgi:hypothetical protein
MRLDRLSVGIHAMPGALLCTMDDEVTSTPAIVLSRL